MPTGYTANTRFEFIMTEKEKYEFEALPTVQERAIWLLRRGVAAQIDIDPATLSLVMRPVASGVLLPGSFDSEADAVEAGTAFLTEKTMLTASDIDRISEEVRAERKP